MEQMTENLSKKYDVKKKIAQWVLKSRFLYFCNFTKIHKKYLYTMCEGQGHRSKFKVTGCRNYDIGRWAHININLHFFYRFIHQIQLDVMRMVKSPQCVSRG